MPSKPVAAPEHRPPRKPVDFAVRARTFPWTKSAEHPALTQDSHRMIVEEQRSTAGLVQFLFRRRVAPPFLGSYPEPFTALNYVSLDYLLPLLVEHQQKAIADLERDQGRLTDAEAHAEVLKILEIKRRHLQSLKALAEKQLQTVG